MICAHGTLTYMQTKTHTRTINLKKDYIQPLTYIDGQIPVNPPIRKHFLLVKRIFMDYCYYSWSIILTSLFTEGSWTSYIISCFIFFSLYEFLEQCKFVYSQQIFEEINSKC